ncbi:MAG: helix-turn-helix domain-containing protein [Endomicrobiales bacterium]|nr:helix-turn-helix domain-containing protein [Endomicrobiales bacterium]
MEKSIGRKIKLARTELGFTQQELAKKLNTSHSVIATWENDKFMPNQESLKKLAQALNKPITYFFDYASKDDPKEKSSYSIAEESTSAYGNNTLKLPIVSNIPEDLRQLGQDNILGYMEIPRFLFPGGKCIVQAANSKTPEISDGDYCIIKTESPVLKNDIVLVKSGNSFYFQRIIKGKSTDLKLLGQVIGIIKKVT